MSTHAYHRRDIEVAGGLLRVGVWEPTNQSAPVPPTVLALHGITANHLSWMFLPEQLPGVRVVAPDLRGRGRSNRLPGPYGIGNHTEDLIAVLTALGTDRATVVGHSMGAFVAVELAYRHPATVSELLLVDGGLPITVPPGVDATELTQKALGPAIERLSMSFPDQGAYREFWRSHPAFDADLIDALGDYFDYDLESDGDRWRPSACIEAVRTDQAELLDTGAVTAALGSVQQPIRFAHASRGMLDDAPLYPAEQVTMWERHLPSMTTTWSTGLNHYTIIMSRAGARLMAQQLSTSGEGGRR